MSTQLLAADLTPEAVLEFWFNDHGHPADPGVLFRRWFKGGADVEHAVAEQFRWAVDQALANGLKDWEIYPAGRLALVIILDQFCRQVFKGTVKAFMGDHRALRLATIGWGNGEFDTMPWPMRAAALMPFQHSEKLTDQEFSVSQFKRLYDQAEDNQRDFLEGLLFAAINDRDVIERFGRFPQRNQILGRANRGDEDAFLTP